MMLKRRKEYGSLKASHEPNSWRKKGNLKKEGPIQLFKEGFLINPPIRVIALTGLKMLHKAIIKYV